MKENNTGGNPFENNYLQTENGYKQFDNEPRPNKEILEAKRDEYVAIAVNEVVKKYDQNKIDIIAKHIDDIDADAEAKRLLSELIEDIHQNLQHQHNINLENLSPSGKMSAEDRRISDALDEIYATYPKELIIGNIKALLETGYIQ